MNSETTPSTLPVIFKTARALHGQFGPSGLERLDVDCGSAASMHLDRVLHSRIIGQDESLQLLTSAFSRLLADLRDPGRPALSFLVLGPTGVGKTETARAFADALFGDEPATA